jgi:hypothetical protein
VKHRHIEGEAWTLTAIDSAIERGDLEDWREMFRAAREDREVALKIERIALARNDDPGYALARALLKQLQEK